jgi:hypothetical protein
VNQQQRKERPLTPGRETNLATSAVADPKWAQDVDVHGASDAASVALPLDRAIPASYRS